MSAAVTEPNSLPPSPARAVTWIGLVVRRVGELLGRLLVRGRHGSDGCGASRLAWSTTPFVATIARPRGTRKFRGVAVGDLEQVSLAAELLDVFAQDDPHSSASAAAVDLRGVRSGGLGTDRGGLLDRLDRHAFGELLAAHPTVGGGASGVGIGADRSARSPRSRRPLRLRWVTWRTL